MPKQHIANAKQKLAEADETLELARAARAHAVREYVLAQRSLWRRIPNLAGKALRAQVHGSGFERVHQDGMWEIFFGTGGAVLINCRSAEIVDYDNTPANDSFVAKLSVDALDAHHLIEDFEADASRRRKVA
jgi:hypothetical protein